jgi:hypothetical protein
MTKISGKELIKFHDTLKQYCVQYTTEVDTNEIATILNESISLKHSLNNCFEKKNK